MAMEIESFEFSVEDLLVMHQGWITKLWVEDRKTEVQIIELLYERHLAVSLQQIRNCLQSWGLLSSNSTSSRPSLELELDVRSFFSIENTELFTDTHSVSDGWELVHSYSPLRRSSSPTLPLSPSFEVFEQSATNSAATGELDYETINLYKERPLPSLPSSTQHKRNSSQYHHRPKRDKLKLTCHHSTKPYDVEITLGILEQGSSPIETYIRDDQNHERIAVGLGRNHACCPDIFWRRAGQRTSQRSGTTMGKKICMKRERKKKDGQDR